MSGKKFKETEFKINKIEDESAEKEVQGILNSIKDRNINEGIIPKTTSRLLVNDFAGKKLSRSKSVILNGQQFFVKAGTKWEDVDKFARKHIVFSEDDFK